MGFFRKLFNQEQNNSKVDWKNLSSAQDLADAIDHSYQQPVIIFKHSTRCSISLMAKKRLERNWDFEETEAPVMYYLDLIAYRDLSNKIAADLAVQHESPQLLLVENGIVSFHCSHSAISVEVIHQALEA